MSLWFKEEKKYCSHFLINVKGTSEQSMGNIYQITKKLCGQKRNACMPIRDKQGTMITSEKEQRCIERFEKLLNRLDPQSRTKISVANLKFRRTIKIKIIATIKRSRV